LPIDARSSPSPQSRATFSWFLLISATIPWATSYIADKLALSDGTAVVLILTLRMSIYALILLPLLIAKRKEIKLAREDLPQLALPAWIGFVINKLFEFGGLARTTASDVALLITSESIFTTTITRYVTGYYSFARSAYFYENCRRCFDYYKCVRHFKIMNSI
jgi:drug/metabolite transporter (DMT)-like permease